MCSVALVVIELRFFSRMDAGSAITKGCSSPTHTGLPLLSTAVELDFVLGSARVGQKVPPSPRSGMAGTGHN